MLTRRIFNNIQRMSTTERTYLPDYIMREYHRGWDN